MTVSSPRHTTRNRSPESPAVHDAASCFRRRQFRRARRLRRPFGGARDRSM